MTFASIMIFAFVEYIAWDCVETGKLLLTLSKYQPLTSILPPRVISGLSAAKVVTAKLSIKSTPKTIAKYFLTC
jgi:hypothetical protein